MKYYYYFLLFSSYALHGVTVIERDVPKKVVSHSKRSHVDDAPITIANELLVICRAVQAKVLLEIGCSSDGWVEQLDLDDCFYIGVDVDEHIAKQRATIADKEHAFLCLDALHDPLPKADLVFCYDLFKQLDAQGQLHLVRNIYESGSEFLLLSMHTEQLDRMQKNGCVPLVLLKAEHSALRKGTYALWLVADVYKHMCVA